MNVQKSSKNNQFRRITRCVDSMFEEGLYFLEDLGEEVGRLLDKKDWKGIFFLLHYYETKAEEENWVYYQFSHKSVLKNVIGSLYQEVDRKYKRKFEKEFDEYLQMVEYEENDER